MARTDIAWATRVESTTTGWPGFALGAPDGQSAGVFEGQSATFAGWDRASYEGLAELLGTVVAGDVVTPEILAGADLVAFEMNGNAPAHSGGWESCDWEFRDSQSSVVVHWDESTVDGAFLGTPVPRDSHVVANGSISGDRYGAFFGLPPSLVTTGQPSLTPAQVVVSFLLFRVRGEIDITGPAFRLTLTGVPKTPTSPNSTPDPDAIGVLLHADMQPPRPVHPVESPTRQVLDLCRLGVDEAVVPALAAVWKRHVGGQPARNDFEGEIHDVLDRIPVERRAALSGAFEHYEEFRRLGTDRCVFTDRLGGVVADRPLEREEFAAELLREGFRFGAQKFFRGSGGEMGAGQVRPWRRVTAISEDTGLVGVAAWPWITAILPRPDNDSEFGNTESFIPPPGGRWQPLPFQFDQICELRPALDGGLSRTAGVSRHRQEPWARCRAPGATTTTSAATACASRPRRPEPALRCAGSTSSRRRCGSTCSRATTPPALRSCRTARSGETARHPAHARTAP